MYFRPLFTGFCHIVAPHQILATMGKPGPKPKQSKQQPQRLAPQGRAGGPKRTPKHIADAVAGQDLYNVADIIATQLCKNASGVPERQWLVRWEGYGPEGDTWEPLGNLAGCEAFVRRFEDEQRKKEEADAKEKELARKEKQLHKTTAAAAATAAPETVGSIQQVDLSPLPFVSTHLLCYPRCHLLPHYRNLSHNTGRSGHLWCGVHFGNQVTSQRVHLNWIMARPVDKKSHIAVAPRLCVITSDTATKPGMCKRQPRRRLVCNQNWQWTMTMWLILMVQQPCGQRSASIQRTVP